MVIDRLLLYLSGAANIALVAVAGWAYLVHGHARYTAGRAFERAEQARVIAALNDTIYKINDNAAKEFGAQDTTISALRAEISRLAGQPQPAGATAACDMPPSVRAKLNTIGGAP